MTFFSDREGVIPRVYSYNAAIEATIVDPSLYRNWGKRWLDVAIVLFVLPIAAPLILISMVLVALDGKSPVYWQKRLGMGGRVFSMVKVRTMVADADARLAAYLETDPEVAREWHEKQKLQHDPRVTAVGRFLRKTSLDELPQLWNVLKGEMSIVGPRPMMTNQQHLYPGTEYYQMRPGITCLWQISERNKTTFAKRSMYDARYYQSISLGTDLRIILATAKVMVRCTGC